MDINKFWEVINLSRMGYKASEVNTNDFEKQEKIVINQLCAKSIEDVLGFEKVYKELMNKAHKKELYHAFILVDMSGGSDYFEWFRSWLIFQGVSIFMDVVNKPDNLAKYITEQDRASISTEQFTGITDQVYQMKLSNVDIPHSNYPSSIHMQSGIELSESFDYSEIEDWDEETFKSSYPKLYEKFGFPF